MLTRVGSDCEVDRVVPLNNETCRACMRKWKCSKLYNFWDMNSCLGDRQPALGDIITLPTRKLATASSSPADYAHESPPEHNVTCVIHIFVLTLYKELVGAARRRSAQDKRSKDCQLSINLSIKRSNPTSERSQSRACFETCFYWADKKKECRSLNYWTTCYRKQWLNSRVRPFMQQNISFLLLGRALNGLLFDFFVFCLGAA